MAVRDKRLLLRREHQDDEGDSAWNKRFKKGCFKGPVIPFGCLVDFKQTPAKEEKMPKAAPDSVPGIMFGYKLNPGGFGSESSTSWP